MNLFTTGKNILHSVLTDERDRKNLYKIALPSFLIHFIAAILALAIMFIMTRTLGTTQYGLFTFAFSIIFLIVNLSTNAIDILTVREIPALVSTGKMELWKGFCNWSSRLILLIGIIIPLLAALCIWAFVYYFHVFKESTYTLPILFALTSIPFYSLTSYYASTLRGQNKPVISLLPDNIIKPLAFILSFIAVYFISRQMTLRNAILLNSASFVAGFIFTFFAYKRTAYSVEGGAQYDLKKWRASWRSLFLLTVIFSINSKLDVLMLGFLKASGDVGVYAAADRVAGALTVFLMVMNTITAATISKLHTLNEKQKLQNMVTKITRGVMLLSLPAYSFIIIFSKYILHFCGPNFSDGQTALIIICTAQLISIAFGPVGNYAVMTGNEKLNIRYSAIKIFLAIALNLALTPALGINGTAIATGLSIVFWNAGMFITLKKKTGLSTWIFG